MERPRLATPASAQSDHVRHGAENKLSPPQKRRKRLQNSAIRHALVQSDSLKQLMGIPCPMKGVGGPTFAVDIDARLGVMERMLSHISNMLSVWLPANSDAYYNNIPDFTEHADSQTSEMSSTGMHLVPDYVPSCSLNPLAPDYVPIHSAERSADSLTTELNNNKATNSDCVHWKAGNKKFVFELSSPLHKELQHEAASTLQRYMRWRLVKSAPKPLHELQRPGCDDDSCCESCLSSLRQSIELQSCRTRRRQPKLCKPCMHRESQRILRISRLASQERQKKKEFNAFDQVKSYPLKSHALQRLEELGYETPEAQRILEEGCARENTTRGSSRKQKQTGMPLSAWQLFVQEHKPQHSGDIGEVAKQLSKLWSDESIRAERNRYEEVARLSKTEWLAERSQQSVGT